MKKRVFSLFLALTMVLCSLSITAWAKKEERPYGTVPIYIGYVDVDYMAQQLLQEIKPTGDTPRERILSVYNWILQNCDREGAADKTYFDEKKVAKESAGAFLDDMEDGLDEGSIVIRMDIASSLQKNSYMVPYDSNYYIATFAYQMMLYRVGNCAHYAALLNLLLGHMGYDCRLIDGEFINNDGSRFEHKWNMVLLDGKYYWLDPRMDHAKYVSSGKLDHSYFLVESKETWAKKHAWEDDYSDALMESAEAIVEGYGLLAAIPGMVEDAFADMTPWSNCSAWAEPFLQQAVDKQLYPDALLQTDTTQPITRAEFAAVAVKYYEALTGKTAKLSKDYENPFSDAVEEAILIANDLGVVNGTSDTTFGPNERLTRAQAATMLGRVAELVQTKAIGDGAALVEQAPALAFADTAKIDGWAVNYVRYFVGNGAINGVEGNRYAPADPMTREQALKVAVAALGE